MLKKALIAAAVSSVITLSGCGGGGGGSSDGDTFLGATTSGKVAKGIIQQGLVTAEELDINGVVIREVGSATTDDSGEYALTITDNYAGGVIRLSIASDGINTQMKCDVQPDCNGTPFGQSIDLDASFSMQALLPSVADGEEVSAQITPFTHMAAARVSGGAFDSSAVRNATSEVSQIVGVPILEAQPVDITDPVSIAAASSEELVYAAFNAGVGDILFQADTLEEGLTALADAFDDGVFDADDSLSIVDITDAVADQATESGLVSSELDQVLVTITSELEDTDDDGIPDTYNPEPTDSATLTAVEQARALVSETRTLITSLEALEDPADAFAGNLELAAEVVDLNSEALFEILGMALEAVFDELDARSIADTLALGTFPVTVEDSIGTSIGDVTVTLSDNNGLVLAITGTDLRGVDMALNVDTNIPATEALAGQSFVMSSVDLSISGSVENTEASITLNETSAMVSLAGAVSIDPDTGDTDPAEPQLTGIELSGGMTIEDKTSDTSFSGDASVSLVALGASTADDPSDPNPISLSEISLDGVFADPNDSLTASVGLTVNNAATFDTIAFLDHEAEMWVNYNQAGDVLGVGSIALSGFGITTLQSAWYQSWDNQTCFYGFDDAFSPISDCLAGDVADVAGAILEDYPGATAVNSPSFNYSLDFGTYYSGEVIFPDFETAENFADVTLTASLGLALSGHPDTGVVITVNRTELEGGDATLTFTHDGHSITVAVDKPDGDDANGLVTVTNPDGVELALSGLSEADDSISGTLTVNGDQVGTVSETDTGLVILRYDDGTFESLN